MLNLVGIERIHNGWYTVKYNGIKLDKSTIFSAKYNKGGEIQ